MNTKLKELKKINSENCVTLVLNTHRTAPDNQKDVILLKNLIKETEERLLQETDKKSAQSIVEHLSKLESEIDHNHNLESLMLFVNVEKGVSEFMRLPVAVTDRVIIGDTFATRDLLRAIHLNSNYYVLVLSQQKVRLIQAFNDEAIKEFTSPFPIENTELYTTGIENSNASRQTSLLAEFFNRIDKEVNKIRKVSPLPVMICSEDGSFHDYLKIADEKHSIYEMHLNGNRLEEKAAAIVKEAWPILKEHVVSKNNARKSELDEAVGTGRFLSDVNDIYQAINEGRIQTLFVQQGLFQPAVMDKDFIQLLVDKDEKQAGMIDDIFDELIEFNLNHGGDAVFLPAGTLDEFNGFGAITRY
jgi:hypothetical protein